MKFENPDKVFFVSDTHFFHKNIIKYCDRPFSDVDEMNQFMIDRWNEAVGPDDIVIHVGDVFMGRYKSFQESGLIEGLNGRKILIEGNRDRSAKRMKLLGFDEVHKSVSLELPNGKVALLKHIPQEDTEGCDYQFHGHTHSRLKIVDRHVNFTVEAWDYKPISLSDVMKIL